MTHPAPRNAPEKKKITWRQVFSPWLFCLLLPLCALLVFLARSYPDLVEKIYANRVYPLMARLGSMLTGMVSISLAEWLFYSVCVCLLIYPFFLLIRFIFLPQRIRRLLRSIARICASASVLLTLFLGMWGLNYYRLPYATIGGYPVAPSTDAELRALTVELLTAAAELRQDLPEDEQGVMRLTDEKSMLQWVPTAYAHSNLPGLATLDVPSKPVLFSKNLSRVGISGIFMPFTYEANVNVHQPDFLKTITACHEGAHLRGIARENEASFLAYLVCINSDNPEYAYSGALFAFIQCRNAMYDDAEGRTLVDNLIPNAIRRDMAANTTYWQAFQGKPSEIQSQINDTYLKANGQQSGTRSYGEVVDLLLAMRRKNGDLQLM